MVKSLKGKITLVYLILIFIIGIVGAVSVVNLFTLSHSIDNLMVHNYKSIKASSNMISLLEEENSYIKEYLTSSDYYDAVKMNRIREEFLSSSYDEKNNITESGEKELVNNLLEDYTNFLDSFGEIENGKINNKENIRDIYNKKTYPLYIKTKNELNKIVTLNEKAMFNSKKAVTKSCETSIYVITIMSVFFICLSLYVSRRVILQILKPIYVLTEAFKSFKDGKGNNNSLLLSDDEFGSMLVEFNKMTERIEEYENSNLGELVTEKNKSLAIIQSIQDPLIVLDINYKILLINEASKEFFNIKENAYEGKHILEVLRNSEIYDIISEVFNSNRKSYSKITSFYKEDKEYYYNITVNLIQDDRNSDKGIVILFQNVTDLKKLERVKTDFLSTISHEIKTPLTSIIMGTSLLDNTDVGSLNERQKKVLDTIKEDSERLSSLVSNLLQLSKLQSNRSIYNFIPCSIHGIIENSIHSFYDTAEAKEVSLYYELSDDLPRIKGDPEKIGWVLNNLISNALRYTMAGDEILVSAEVSNNFMMISVKDTGIGIPEDYVDKIFNKFVQVNKNGNFSNGTGLGLTISKEIVTSHGGNMWCKSKLDLGSTFFFTIPLNKE